MRTATIGNCEFAISSENAFNPVHAFAVRPQYSLLPLLSRHSTVSTVQYVGRAGVPWKTYLATLPVAVSRACECLFARCETSSTVVITAVT